MKKFENKSVLITGSTGTIGSALVYELVNRELYNPRLIVGIDNNETKIFEQTQLYLGKSNVDFFVSDIRDADTLTARMRDIDIVIHCAALKHVLLCERSPEECLKTNIQGVQNVIRSAVECNVETVIFTSSDKAVNPTNVMGTSKLMGERLMTAASSTASTKGPIFASTRFGNVLGSSGSVVPIFRRQIESGDPLTLTHKEMTRFAMSVSQAVDLVLQSVSLAQGGEVFITKMPVIRIDDLAKVMIEHYAQRKTVKNFEVAIREIGPKPGEKLYEELMTQEETRRALELESYFVVSSPFEQGVGHLNYPNVKSRDVKNPYISKNEISLDKVSLHEFLVKYEVI